MQNNFYDILLVFTNGVFNRWIPTNLGLIRNFVVFKFACMRAKIVRLIENEKNTLKGAHFVYILYGNVALTAILNKFQCIIENETVWKNGHNAKSYVNKRNVHGA